MKDLDLQADCLLSHLGLTHASRAAHPTHRLGYACHAIPLQLSKNQLKAYQPRDTLMNGFSLAFTQP